MIEKIFIKKNSLSKMSEIQVNIQFINTKKIRQKTKLADNTENLSQNNNLPENNPEKNDQILKFSENSDEIVEFTDTTTPKYKENLQIKAKSQDEFENMQINDEIVQELKQIPAKSSKSLFKRTENLPNSDISTPTNNKIYWAIGLTMFAFIGFLPKK